MTTTIQRRVAALEEMAGGGECPECGFRKDENPPFEVVFVDGPSKPEEFCETCGRQLTFAVTLNWDVSPRLPERR